MSDGGQRAAFLGEDDAGGEIGPEAGQYVAQWKLLAVGGCVGEALDDDGVRAGAHLSDDPVAGFLRRRSAGHAWAEVDLRLGVAVRRAATEPGRRRSRRRC